METPNIVVIMADQLKATALGVYGNPACPTPSLERLAEDGVCYENAFTPHPLCVPARVAFWTGRYPHQTGCRRNETLMPAQTDHAIRRFKAQGYHCALIGKNHCFQADDYSELFDTWLELGHFGLVENGWKKGEWCTDTAPVEELHRNAAREFTGPDRHLRVHVADCEPEAHTTGIIGTQSVEFIRNQRDPFALWISFPAPHEPYIVPRRSFDSIDPTLIELPPFDPAQIELLPSRSRFLYRMLNAEGRSDTLLRSVRAYLANALFIDEQVGRILDAISAAGLRENTIVVFCSDHGDFAGEFNMMVKGGTFADCLTRVPLLLSWPGVVPRGRREERMANLVDVAPTLYSLSAAADERAPSDSHLGPADRLAGTVLFSGPAKEHAKAGPNVGPTDPVAPADSDPARPDAAFSEYGAGMQLLPPEVEQTVLEEHEGMDAVMATLQWREAEGRRKMVRTHEWKYTHDPADPVDELYDLQNDPHERWNLAGDPEYAAVVGRMRALLCDWSIRTEDAGAVELPCSTASAER